MFPTKKVQSMIGSRVQVEMKGDEQLLEGTLESVDDYLNLHLLDTVEIVDGEQMRSLGQVVLRGNNIILKTADGGDRGTGTGSDTPQHRWRFSEPDLEGTGHQQQAVFTRHPQAAGRRSGRAQVCGDRWRADIQNQLLWRGWWRQQI